MQKKSYLCLALSLSLSLIQSPFDLAEASTNLSILSTIESVSCNGTGFFVDAARGSDSNDGTSESSPWQTLAKVNSFSFASNDCIFFRRGAQWSGQLNISRGELTLAAYGTGDARPIINASGEDYGIFSTGNSNLLIRDFEIKNAQKEGLRIYGGTTENITIENVYTHHNGVNNNGFGMFIGSSSNVVVRNSEAAFNGWNGIQLNSWGTDKDLSQWLVDHCLSHHNEHHGIDINTGTTGIDISNVVIRYNATFENLSGIYVERTAGEDISDVLIHHNLSYDNGRVGIFIQPWPDTTRLSDNVRIYHNVMYGNGTESGTFGMGLIAKVTHGDIRNNIIFNNNVTNFTEREIKVWNAGGGANAFDHNVVYNDDVPENGLLIGWDTSSTDTGKQMTYAEFVALGQNTHGFNQGPDMVDPAAGDFHLLDSSVAVDRGDNLGFSQDYDGQAIPQGAGYDVGAYEFSGGGQTQTFADVPFTHWAHDEIEALYQAGYVAGCSASPKMYCPDTTMTRAESAVFVVRGVHGAGYMPGQPSEAIFGDVALSEWYAKWTNQLWEDGYTAGCGTGPLVYCPFQAHTRTEGTVFFLRMLNGPGYTPPDPAGLFADVTTNFWGARWIEAAYAVGLIPACKTSPELMFCPEGPLDRAMGAYMMFQAKGLGDPQG